MHNIINFDLIMKKYSYRKLNLLSVILSFLLSLNPPLLLVDYFRLENKATPFISPVHDFFPLAHRESSTLIPKYLQGEPVYDATSPNSSVELLFNLCA